MDLDGILKLVELLSVRCIPMDLDGDEIGLGDEFDRFSEAQGILIKVCAVVITVLYVVSLSADLLHRLIR